MLSAQAYSFHQKSRLAITLSWIGGYTNVVSVMACGAYVSHATGNTTRLGLDLATGEFGSAAFVGFVLLAFLAGAAVSGFLSEGARLSGARSKYMAPMIIEAILLTAFAWGLQRHPTVGPADTFTMYWMCGVAALAMGLQNATITMISGDVRTTHVTGVITDLGLEGVRYLVWYWQKSRGRGLRRDGRLLLISTRHPTALRLLLLASMFGSFLFGVVAGAYVFRHWHSVVFVPPILFLIFILLRDWYKPIADVREINMLSDPELQSLGLVHSLLPKELGIYRLAMVKHGLSHRAPNFQAWVDRLPGHWSVVILVIQPLLRLDDNALMDFGHAVRKLQGQGRSLVLCGTNPPQYAAMERAGLIDLIGWENLCPDVEFAVSRGMDLLRGRK
ncbi:MAG: DUF1275 family protein [Planctomycetes bacterium]|nr:DUF1275 family protein [Planctomycetota bacterium]